MNLGSGLIKGVGTKKALSYAVRNMTVQKGIPCYKRATYELLYYGTKNMIYYLEG